MSQITINPVLNPILSGWVVKVGCLEVTFLDLNLMCLELKRYLKNPKGVEREYQG